MRLIAMSGRGLRRTLLALAPLMLTAAAPADGLPRRGLMGVQLGPVTAEMATERKLENTQGMAVLGVVPDTAASAAGLQAGDVIQSIGDKPVESLAGGLGLLRGFHAGDTARLGVLREGKTLELPLTLRERPRETATDFEIVYDCAGAPGHRVRTIVSRPKDAGRHPAILFVQSLNPGSLEFSDPQLSRHPYKQLCDQLTRAGFVVMRADREGNGDSEGGDPRRPHVADDVRSFGAALDKLAAYDYVDPQRVYVFAQSSGAAIAPALARHSAARGVITYAAIARPWIEHMPETLAANWKLAMVEDDELTGNVAKARQFTQLCIVDGKNPQEVLAAHPELAEIAPGLVDGEYVMGSHYSFFHELAALDLAAEWRAVKVPVLALWGEADYVATRACSEFIAKNVAAGGNERCRFMEVKGIDHNYAPMEDAEESYLAQFTGEFNPVIVETIKTWIAQQAPPSAS